LPVIIVISISLAFGYQDAAAMTVIFDSGPPASADIVIFNNPGGFLVEDFIPNMSASVTDLHFFAIDDPSLLSVGTTFAYQIRDAGAAQPGNIIIGQGTATVVDIHPFPALCDNCIEVWTDFDNPVPVSQGQTYWILIEAIVLYQYIIEVGPVLDPVLFTFDFVDYNVLPSIFLFNFPIQVTALTAIGGKIISIETTALLLTGAQTFSWMIPVILSVLGIGLFVVRRN